MLKRAQLDCGASDGAPPLAQSWVRARAWGSYPLTHLANAAICPEPPSPSPACARPQEGDHALIRVQFNFGGNYEPFQRYAPNAVFLKELSFRCGQSCLSGAGGVGGPAHRAPGAVPLGVGGCLHSRGASLEARAEVGLGGEALHMRVRCTCGCAARVGALHVWVCCTRGCSAQGCSAHPDLFLVFALVGLLCAKRLGASSLGTPRTLSPHTPTLDQSCRWGGAGGQRRCL